MALALGRTVAELEAGLSGAELAEWRAFFVLENARDPQAELAAQAAAGIDNAIRERRARIKR